MLLRRRLCCTLGLLAVFLRFGLLLVLLLAAVVLRVDRHCRSKQDNDRDRTRQSDEFHLTYSSRGYMGTCTAKRTAPYSSTRHCDSSDGVMLGSQCHLPAREGIHMG